MRRPLAPFAFLIAALLAWVAPPGAEAENWPPNYPLPQDAMLLPRLENIHAVREDVQEIRVAVDLGEQEPTSFWNMSHTQIEVFLDKLETLPAKPLPEDDIWPKLKAKDPHYKGIVILIQTVEGKRFAPLRVFEGKLIAMDPQYSGTVNTVVAPDYGRHLEYWLFGTARVRRDQLVGVSVLPVLTFEQCRLLGQRIVETTPRQCLLPDNNLLLESNELPTARSAKIASFDECLKEGKALIYTFPRRCVAAGGRVFTEPPKVVETPPVIADVPLAAEPAEASRSLSGLISVTPTIPPQAALAQEASALSSTTLKQAVDAAKTVLAPTPALPRPASVSITQRSVSLSVAVSASRVVLPALATSLTAISKTSQSR